MSRITKSLHYFRAAFDNRPLDLETYLRNMLQLAANVASSQVRQYDQITQIQYRNPQPQDATYTSIGGLLLHIGNGTLDEHRRTIQNHTADIQDIGGTQAPPAGHSFLNREAFLYVKQHHVIFCGHGGFRPGAVVSYLVALNEQLRQQHEDLALLEFDLYAVADGEQLRLIRERGVRYISLNASVYDLTMQQIYQDSQSALAKMLSKFGSCMREDPSEEEITAAADIQAGVWLSLTGNRRASLEAQELIRHQAEQIIDDDELDTGFYIETQTGEKIRPKDIKLSTTARLKKYEQTNSLVMTDAFRALLEYFSSLENSNLTEQ